MQSQHYQSDNQANQIDFGGINLVNNKQKVLKLDNATKEEIKTITSQSSLKSIFNGHLDPRNESRPFKLTSIRKNIQFNNFLTKKRNEYKRLQGFEIIREILQQKYGNQNISTISQRESKCMMVVRFVNKIDHQTMEIQDQKCKERQRIKIKNCVVWVGLICVIEAVYENGMYRLDKIVDIGYHKEKKQNNNNINNISNNNINNNNNININNISNNNNKGFSINYPLSVYRIAMIKGPFWKNNGKENIGIKILSEQLLQLRNTKNIRIDYLIVMGPILSQHNEHVKNFTLENTYQQQYMSIVQTLKNQLTKFLPQLQILIMPSTDDIISTYPIPQPALNPQSIIQFPSIKYSSNPCIINLQSFKHQIQLNLINYDMISYIDTFRCGKSIKQPLIENIQTYLKSPFLLSNTLQNIPFDEVNLSQLFNQGKFGDVIIISSNNHPVFAHKVKGKVFVNIGALGVDGHVMGKHYITIMSLYDGQGDVSERVKIEAVVM